MNPIQETQTTTIFQPDKSLQRFREKPFIARQILKIALPIIAVLGLTLAVISIVMHLPTIVFMASLGSLAFGISGNLTYNITRFIQKLLMIRSKNVEEEKRKKEYEMAKVEKKPEEVIKEFNEEDFEKKIETKFDEKMKEYIKVELEKFKKENLTLSNEINYDYKQNGFCNIPADRLNLK